MSEDLISDNELDALLRERDPLDSTGWGARELKPVLAQLAREIARPPTSGPVSVRPQRFLRRRRLLSVAGSGILVAAAALIGFNVLGGGATQSLLPGTQLPVAQAAELNKIAAATAGGPSAGRGKWLYLKVLTSAHQGLQVGHAIVFYSVSEAVQVWDASATGPTRVRVTFSHFSFASAHARNVFEAHHAIYTQELAALPLPPKRASVIDAVFPRGYAVSPTDIGNGSGSKVPLSSLPTDPEALVARLGHKHLKAMGPASSRRRQGQLFVSANEALGEWIGLTQILIASTSAAQRAEAYRALTLVRFVRVIGEHRDSRGRLGTEISFHIPGAGSPTSRLIIDPRTGNLLQINDGTGHLTLWLTRAKVKSDTDLPSGATQALPHPSLRDRQFPLLGLLAGSGLLG